MILLMYKWKAINLLLLANKFTRYILSQDKSNSTQDESERVGSGLVRALEKGIFCSCQWCEPVHRLPADQRIDQICQNCQVTHECSVQCSNSSGKTEVID